jgi:glucose-6-phosphate 1-dehydrogenase
MPTILIVVGITGDLASRKLLPAVEALAKAGMLPEQFRILGTTRQAQVAENRTRGEDLAFVEGHMQFFHLDVNDTSAYERLAGRLQEIERDFGSPAQRLFYLAVPPEASKTIIEKLGTSGLAQVPDTKLLLEKPFGIDLPSARDLITHTERYFTSEQIYRIDHYLAKEIAQHLITLHESNSLHMGDKEYIEHIDILAAEEIGVEGRVHFYEQTGALRDVLQNHLLQLTALTCLSPATEEGESLSERRLDALQNISIAPEGLVRRAQYEGYRAEVGNPHSTVETYVSLTLRSSAPHLAGIPITLTTGKRLPKKLTEIRVVYKKGSDQKSNPLVIQDEGTFRADMNKRVPDAYERLLIEAIRSNQEIFVSSEEVLESWRIIAPVQEAWKKDSADLSFYAPGTTP